MSAPRFVAPLPSDAAARVDRVLALQDARAAQPMNQMLLRVDDGAGGEDRIRIGTIGSRVGATIDLANDKKGFDVYEVAWRDAAASGDVSADLVTIEKNVSEASNESILTSEVLFDNLSESCDPGGDAYLPRRRRRPARQSGGGLAGQARAGRRVWSARSLARRL